MNLMQKEQKITAALIATARNANKELNEFSIQCYVESVINFDTSEIINCLKQYFKQTKMPTIQQIENYCLKIVDDADEVNETVSRICACINGVGSYNNDRAKSKIGPFGWQIVQSFGGWQQVCDVPDYNALNTMRAQMIKIGLSMRKKANLANRDSNIIQLNQTQNEQQKLNN